ncbi:MAG: hypothetical protein ABMA64_28945 [Myxococcota bacterium]
MRPAVVTIASAFASATEPNPVPAAATSEVLDLRSGEHRAGAVSILHVLGILLAQFLASIGALRLGPIEGSG